MAMDKREDPADFYPGGSAIVTPERGGGGGTVEFDTEPTEGSLRAARSGGIFSWVKGLLPAWLTPSMTKPVESVNRKTGSVELTAYDVLTAKQLAVVNGEITHVPVIVTHRGNNHDASLYDDKGELIFPRQLDEKLSAGYAVFFRRDTEDGHMLYALSEVSLNGSAWFYCIMHGKIVSMLEVNAYGLVQDPVAFPVEPVFVNVASGQLVTLHGNEYVCLTGSFLRDAVVRLDQPTDELTFLVHAAQSVNDATILGESIEDRFVWKSAANPVAGSVKLSDFAGSLLGWKRINIRRFRTTDGYNCYHLEAN